MQAGHSIENIKTSSPHIGSFDAYIARSQKNDRKSSRVLPHVTVFSGHTHWNWALCQAEIWLGNIPYDFNLSTFNLILSQISCMQVKMGVIMWKMGVTCHAPDHNRTCHQWWNMKYRWSYWFVLTKTNDHTCWQPHHALYRDRCYTQSSCFPARPVARSGQQLQFLRPYWRSYLQLISRLCDK